MKVRFEITHLYDEDCFLHPVEKKVVINVEMDSEEFFHVELQSHEYETKKYCIETGNSCMKRGIRTFSDCKAWVHTEEQKEDFDELQEESEYWKELQELAELYAYDPDENWWDR